MEHCLFPLITMQWYTFLEIWNLLNVTTHSIAASGLHDTHLSQMPTFWLLTTEEETFKNCDQPSADWQLT